MKTKREWEPRGKNETVKQYLQETLLLSEDIILNPKRDPYIWHLEEAASIIRSCIKQKMPVTIVGDYDADGMMASSILKLYLNDAGIDCRVRLPRRFSEGYGLSTKIIDEIETGLVITVDNGIKAHEAIRKAKKKGLTVVVTDHHEGSMEGLIADIVVDPHMEEDDYSEFTDYCGAGIAYRLGKMLFPDSKIHKKAEVLAGIATVADVVPILGDNRNIVKNSLKYLNAGLVPKGLRLLLDVLGKEHYDEVDYGFTIGPVINASGRLLDNGPDDIVRLVTTDQELRRNPELRKVMDELVVELIRRNEERKELVRQYLEEAYGVIQREKLENDPFLVVHVPQCHEGIIGILAGRIEEEMLRPCIVLTESAIDGTLKGSGRCDTPFNLKELLDQSSDLLEKYGGHAKAAGLSVQTDNVPKLRVRLNESNQEMVLAGAVHFYDMEIRECDIRRVLQEQELYAPYGEGFKKPVVRINGYELLPDAKTGAYAQILGARQSTIKLTGRRSSCIGFDMADRYLEEGSPHAVDIIGTLSYSYMNGKPYPQVEIIDLRKSERNMNAETAALEQLFF